ncbi:MAG: SRPBCC domain-containing protein, partial [Phaeodactylibacter sp.]|nr:SRPBCC domain-containing protein [Phaeodactylibacter sp.]
TEVKKVEASIDIEAPPAKTIGAFIHPAPLRGWWGVERSLIEPADGGVYTLAWKISDKGFGYISSGVIEHYEPGKELRIGHLVYLNPLRDILGPMKLTIRAAGKKTGPTKLYVCQEGYQEGEEWEWYYQSVVRGWPHALKSLKDYLERR